MPPVYNEPEEIFVRDNPSLKKTFINNNGEVKIRFSKPMIFPKSWKTGKRMLQDGTQIIALLKKASDPDGPGEKIPIIITDMQGTNLDLKLQFDNPSIISLSS